MKQNSRRGAILPLHPATLVATCALTTRVIVTYALKDGAAFGHTIIWWNGLFGFGAGFCVTWGYYLSGRWKRNLK